MKKLILLFMAAILSYSFGSNLAPEKQTRASVVGGAWIWEKSFGENGSFTATPKSIGSRKKIVFTQDGKVTTYKNDIELRIGKYEISKGISVHDNLEHDLITIEGGIYVIENLDDHSLIMTRNVINGYSSIYKR